MIYFATYFRFWSIIWWCLSLFTCFFLCFKRLFSTFWMELLVSCVELLETLDRRMPAIIFLLWGRSLRFFSDFAGFIWNRRESRSDHGWKRYILTDINIYLACSIFLFWKLHVLLFIFLIFSFLPIIKDSDMYSILFQIRNNLTF